MGTEERVHVHHEPGRAVAALGAVADRDPVLDRVEAVVDVADPLHGGDVAVGDGGEGAQAGVDRLVSSPSPVRRVIMTVQAPQPPWPQPILVPVRPVSRR